MVYFSLLPSYAFQFDHLIPFKVVKVIFYLLLTLVLLMKYIVQPSKAQFAWALVLVEMSLIIILQFVLVITSR